MSLSLTVDTRHSAPDVHFFSTSTVFLPESGPLQRLPRRPEKVRPDAFYQVFEDRALFYDCFLAPNADIVLVGPPALNLESAFQAATFRAMPSGRDLEVLRFSSRSTMTTVLRGAPADTHAIAFAIAGAQETVPVQPGRADVLANRRVMFTMNKDNDLAWIEHWARWHCALHGVDAIVIFDNGSTRYGLEDIARTLARVKGLSVIGLVSWPFRYGPVDPGVLSHPYWANFLQVASFNAMLRRFGRESAGLLNCDIDELVGTRSGKDVFTTLSASPDGYVKLKGTWIEATTGAGEGALAESGTHFDFQFRHRNPLLAKCANKWALDPRQSWTQDCGIFPMMHRIYGLSRARMFRAPTHRFWHFRGINTNWKETRVTRTPVTADPRRHRVDETWFEARGEFLARQGVEQTSRVSESDFQP